MPEPGVRHRAAVGRRAVAFLILSLAFHLTGWWLAARLPTPPPPKKKETIQVAVIDQKPKPTPAPPKPTVKPPQEEAPKPTPKPLVQSKQKPPEPQEPTPVPPPRPYEPNPVKKPFAAEAPEKTDEKTRAPNPGADAIAGGTPLGTPKGGTKEGGGATGPTDLGQVRLFDSNALGRSVHRYNQGQPNRKEFMATGADGDPNDPLAEQARVGGRIAADIEAADTAGKVSGGLLSTCNDGVDQGMDGFMDCADPGCRQMPACRNTSEYHSRDAGTIPDDSVVGVTSELLIPDDGTIKTATLRINLSHGSPGDLSIELEHATTGKKVKLKVADRTNRFLQKAFLLRDFIGEDSEGRWIVRIRDVFPGVTGSYRGWTLYVTH